MKVFVLKYEGLDPNDTGILAMYSNQYAAHEAMEYANSLPKYFRLWIEVSFVSDKFFKSDLD